MFAREWHKGYAAWIAGKSLATNPFADGSDRSNAWAEGWTTAQYEDFCGCLVE